MILLIIAKNIYNNIISNENSINDPKEIEDNNNFKSYYESLPYIDSSLTETEYLSDIMDEINTDDEINFKKIQKKFYHKIIVKMKSEVSSYFYKTGKILFLNIDGLDSNLDLKKNKKIISIILFNLHEVCSTLFGNMYSQYNINLFLRTDLYSAFKDTITEKDKITKIVFNWQSEHLMQLINSRLNENDIGHIAELLHDSLNMNSLMQKLDKYVYKRPRDYIFLFNNLIQIAQSQKKNYIDNKIFNEALERYALHAGESIEAEFLSLPYQVIFGELLTQLKSLLTKSQTRVSAKKFINLLIDLELEENNIFSFILFLLQIEFIFVKHNSKEIAWNKLSNPEIKLKEIMKKLNNRNFYFPLIIQKFIDTYY